MSNNEHNANELLSNLERLKAKYSSVPETDSEITSQPTPEKPVETAPVKEEAPVKEAPVIRKAQPTEAKVETARDFSWLIDKEEDSSVVQEVPSVIEVTPVNTPVKEEKSDSNWLLSASDDLSQEQSEETPVEDVPAEAETPAEEVSVEDEAPVAKEDSENAQGFKFAPGFIDDSAEEDDEDEDDYDFDDSVEDDDFADLDDEDDLVVIRHESKKEKAAQENVQEEMSPFYAALLESDNKNKAKPPKPVKSQKPPKPAKEPKVKKAKKEKQPKVKKNGKTRNKRLILNIVVSVALVAVLWTCLFVTDIILVSNWYSPVFCAESKTFEDGSKTYIGAFYKMEVTVTENGEIQRFCLPWFIPGPNESK